MKIKKWNDEKLEKNGKNDNLKKIILEKIKIWKKNQNLEKMQKFNFFTVLLFLTLSLFSVHGASLALCPTQYRKKTTKKITKKFVDCYQSINFLQISYLCAKKYGGIIKGNVHNKVYSHDFCTILS